MPQGSAGSWPLDDRVLRVFAGLTAFVLVMAALREAASVFVPTMFALFVITVVWPLQRTLQRVAETRGIGSHTHHGVGRNRRDRVSLKGTTGSAVEEGVLLNPPRPDANRPIRAPGDAAAEGL